MQQPGHVGIYVGNGQVLNSGLNGKAKQPSPPGVDVGALGVKIHRPSAFDRDQQWKGTGTQAAA
ncbi:hypothetical protein [Pseudarthrobacter siccitolerans]